METDKNMLERQKQILTLFYRVKHERLHPEYEKMLENFQIEELANSCTVSFSYHIIKSKSLFFL